MLIGDGGMYIRYSTSILVFQAGVLVVREVVSQSRIEQTGCRCRTDDVVGVRLLR